MKRPESLLSALLCATCGHNGKTAVCKPGGELSPGTNSVSTLIYLDVSQLREFGIPLSSNPKGKCEKEDFRQSALKKQTNKQKKLQRESPW